MMKHSPVMLKDTQGDLSLVGCTCGWRYTNFRMDPDDAIAMHLVMAWLGLINEGHQDHIPSDAPRTGTYRHFCSGDDYQVIGIALEEATLAPIVLYRREANSITWTPLTSFVEEVTYPDGSRGPRFRKIG